MDTMKWLKYGLLASLIVVAVFWIRADLANQSDPAMTNQAANGEKRLLDFSESPNKGVFVGRFNNFAFRIDPQTAVKRISVPVGNQRLPDLIATFDYADCTKGQESLLERSVRDLAAGQPAWVDQMEVVALPPTQREIKWSGGVCYGFREGGKWYWNLTSTPLTYDSSSDRYVARIPVRRGPIDAIKLVFDYSVPPMYVSSVTYTTRQIGSTKDPLYTPPKR